MVFNPDGSYEGLAVVREGSSHRLRVNRGTYYREGNTLTIRHADGRVLKFSLSWEAGVLVLRQEERELRLERAEPPPS